MIYEVLRKDEKIRYVEAIDSDDAFKKIEGNGSVSCLSKEEEIALKKKLKKQMKKVLILENIFLCYCEIIEDDTSKRYRKLSEKYEKKYQKKRKELEKQFSMINMKINHKW